MMIRRAFCTKALPRRTFLKAAGISLALPLLDAMRPALARGGEPPAPRRFVGMMTNMGIIPQYFFPQQEGRDFELTPYLEILKAHRNDLTILSGVSLPGVDGGHASEKSFLTGAPGASRGSFKNSVSLDQIMAEKMGGDTRFPTLSLAIGNESLGLSYTRSGSMIPPERSPLKLYQKLFVENTAKDQAASRLRLSEDRSLLDSLREQSKRLEKNVGAADRDRLDQYFTSVRDLERRLAKSEEWLGKPKPKVAVPIPEDVKDGNDLATNSRAIFDLVRLALETDSTRVVTICVNNASVTPTKIAGVHTNTHELTHHGNREEKLAERRQIELTQFSALAEFLTALRVVRENAQPLFDQTSVLYGTNMGSANSHSNDNLPVLLAGGGFKHVGHLVFDRKKNYPLSNLYVSLLQRMGIEAGNFSSGSSTMRGLAMT